MSNFQIKNYKVVELVGRGSVTNKAFCIKFFEEMHLHFETVQSYAQKKMFIVFLMKFSFDNTKDHCYVRFVLYMFIICIFLV